MVIIWKQQQLLGALLTIKCKIISIYLSVEKYSSRQNVVYFKKSPPPKDYIRKKWSYYNSECKNTSKKRRISTSSPWLAQAHGFRWRDSPI